MKSQIRGGKEREMKSQIRAGSERESAREREEMQSQMRGVDVKQGEVR